MYTGQKMQGRQGKETHMKSKNANDYFSSHATWHKTMLAKYEKLLLSKKSSQYLRIIFN